MSHSVATCAVMVCQVHEASQELCQVDEPQQQQYLEAAGSER